MRKNALLLVAMSVAVALIYGLVADTHQASPRVPPNGELAMPGRDEASGPLGAFPKGDGRASLAVEEDVVMGPKEPSESEVLRAAKFAEFDKYNGHEEWLTARRLADVDLSRKMDSILSPMRKWVIKIDISAEDLRSEIARRDALGSSYKQLILAMPYSKGASLKDLQMVQELAKSSTETTALAAMHALTTFQHYVPDAGEAPLWEVADFNLDRLLAGDRSPAASSTATLALKLIDKLEGKEQAARVEALIDDPEVTEEVRGSALELLARAGGAAGAQRALTALALDDDAALVAVRAIRDPSAATELQALAAQPLSDAKSIATAAAALSGLTAAKPEAALELLEGSILPRFRAAEGPEKQQLTDLVTQALEGISDTRDAGTVKLIAQLLGEDDVVEFWKLPKPWQEAMAALSSRTMTKAFNLPAGERQDEICTRFRSAIEQLPSGSGIYRNALFQLIRVGRPEDLQYVEDNLERSGNRLALRKSLDRRYQDDLNGTVSLSR